MFLSSFGQKVVHQQRFQFATQPDKYNRVHYFAIMPLKIGTWEMELMMMMQRAIGQQLAIHFPAALRLIWGGQ